jgi:hypothetical protein
MTSFTNIVIAKFIKDIDTDKTYSLSEILKVLSASYKEVKDNKKTSIETKKATPKKLSNAAKDAAKVAKDAAKVAKADAAKVAKADAAKNKQLYKEWVQEHKTEYKSHYTGISNTALMAIIKRDWDMAHMKLNWNT